MRKFKVFDKFKKEYIDSDGYFINSKGVLFEFEHEEIEYDCYSAKATGDIVISEVDTEWYSVEFEKEE